MWHQLSFERSRSHQTNADNVLRGVQRQTHGQDTLQSLGLNHRQVKAVLFVKEKGKITNSDYQSLNGISKRTATTELTELADKFKVLTKTGTSGSSISYTIVGQVGQWWSKSRATTGPLSTQ